MPKRSEVLRLFVGAALACGFFAPCFGAGPDLPVDTGAITAFGATADGAGNLWVALGWPDSKLQVFRSSDNGESWRSVLWFPLDGVARQIELLSSCDRGGAGRPAGRLMSEGLSGRQRGHIFIFYLVSSGAGDIWLCRVALDSLSWENLPVAVGPDRIDDFSVTIDRDSNPYLYCLYVNEQARGANGRFTRSLDRGRTWEIGQEWWNAADPEISMGRGSVLHAVWRYSSNPPEIHYCANRAYGRPAYWGDHHVLKSGGPECWDPVVVQSDTGEPVVWVVFTVGRRGKEMTDLEYAYSSDGGGYWRTGGVLGERFLDEWAPVLLADRYAKEGFVDLVYNLGGAGPTDPTVVVWRSVSAADPECWSGAHVISDVRADVGGAGCRPRMAQTGFRMPRGPEVFFSRYSASSASGVYFDAPWRPFQMGRWGLSSGSDSRAGRLADRESLPGAVAEMCLRCTPNPAAGHTVIELTCSADGSDCAGNQGESGGRLHGPGVWRRYFITVYDLEGREVRSMQLPAGTGGLRWDVCDNQGRPVPAGTYVVVARSNTVITRSVLCVCR